ASRAAFNSPRGRSSKSQAASTERRPFTSTRTAWSRSRHRGGGFAEWSGGWRLGLLRRLEVGNLEVGGSNGVWECELGVGSWEFPTSNPQPPTSSPSVPLQPVRVERRRLAGANVDVERDRLVAVQGDLYVMRTGFQVQVLEDAVEIVDDAHV